MNVNKSQFRQRWFVLCALVVALADNGQRAGAQGPAAPARKQADGRVERLEEMKQIAGTFQASTLAASTRTPAAMVREPLYRWNDPTREFSDGTLWFWRSDGRPIAVVAIELYPQNPAFGPVWALEFTSLSTGPIEVEGGEHFDKTYADLYRPRPDGTLRWAPRHGGVQFRELAGAPAPADTEAERARQMRELIQRFSAREHFKSQDYALRLISHPIDRYANSATQILDGQVFLFANGTNPEVLFMIEARRPGAGSPGWWYAAAPLARAEVALILDRKEVWKFKCRDVPAPEDTYFLARKPRRPGAS